MQEDLAAATGIHGKSMVIVINVTRYGRDGVDIMHSVQITRQLRRKFAVTTVQNGRNGSNIKNVIAKPGRGY